MKLSIVVGNPRPASRTLKIAEAVGHRVVEIYGATHTLTVDLADYSSTLFEWPNEQMLKLNNEVAASDIVIFGSPTYKATYTGLLKAFVDRYPNNGLAGVIAIPVMTAATAHHALAIDTGLRPLLVELGASVPTRGCFFLMSQMESLDQVVDRWAADNLTTPGIIGSMVREEAST